MTQPSETHAITLGGGCFWCLEAVYLQVRGVLSVESGYSNGQLSRPSYEAVCSGQTGCVEVVRLKFDPAQISLDEILEIFFLIHDPTTLNRQGHDVGTQYRSGIYTEGQAQAGAVGRFLDALKAQRVGQAPIVTEVLPLADYWPAEAYHQNYYARHPDQGYCVHVVGPKVDKFRRTLQRLTRS
jgi:peptide-methionine (S)-S-oxide reductase